MLAFSLPRECAIVIYEHECCIAISQPQQKCFSCCLLVICPAANSLKGWVEGTCAVAVPQAQAGAFIAAKRLQQFLSRLSAGLVCEGEFVLRLADPATVEAALLSCDAIIAKDPGRWAKGV